MAENDIQEKQKLKEKFKERWSCKNIENMPLEEYNHLHTNEEAEEKYSFCYWLETFTRHLGSIKGGSSSKFGIYQYNPSNEKDVSPKDSGYTWSKKYSKVDQKEYTKAEDVWNKSLRNVIKSIAELASKGDYGKIDDIDFGEATKWKIAWLYEEKDGDLLNIFKRDALEWLCEKHLGNVPKKISEMHKQLIEKNNSGEDSFTYAAKLWHEWEEFDSVGKYEELLKLNKNLILQGAPGTGKTFTTPKLAERITGCSSYEELIKKGQVVFTTFHQSLDYEDFIEGLKPKVVNDKITYEIVPGIFKQICDRASKNSDKKYVLIIDEINRGNVSKIFGELITLIESDKRSKFTAKLPYSKKKDEQGNVVSADFVVPENLYIIGTMNTTDRSTGTLDYALRRRFVFSTLEADEDIVDEKSEGCAETVELSVELFKDIKSFIEVHALPDYEIDDLMIGHSYFMIHEKGKGASEQELKYNLAYKIIPLLKEYRKDGILNCSVEDLEKKCKLWLSLKTVADNKKTKNKAE